MNRGGQMHSTTSATLLTSFLHLHQSAAFSLEHSFSCFLKLVSSISSISSLVGHVYVFHPLHAPLPSSKYLPQVVSKQPYHLTLFVLASLSAAFFNPNRFISSTVFLLSTNFTLYIALTIDLSALLKIATVLHFLLNTMFCFHIT